MKYISVGDMSQTYQLRRHNLQLKTTMTRLTDEVVTGQAKDVGAAVGGDFTALAAINRSIGRSEAFAQVTTETKLMADTQQNALEVVQDHAYAVGSTLVSAAFAANPEMVNTGAADAAVRFTSIIDTLNVSVAGRYAFAGVATDTRPVADADTILSSLKTAIAGLTDATSIEGAVESWFDSDPGFLDDTHYLGSDSSLAPINLSESDKAQISITATDPTLRNMLKGFAIAALVADGSGLSDVDLRSTLIQAAGSRIMSADAQMSTLRSELGTVQGIIGDAQVRNEAEKGALELAKVDLIGVDPYDSATALEAVQNQIETLYTLTSRISKLSLTDYI